MTLVAALDGEDAALDGEVAAFDGEDAAPLEGDGGLDEETEEGEEEDEPTAEPLVEPAAEPLDELHATRLIEQQIPPTAIASLWIRAM